MSLWLDCLVVVLQYWAFSDIQTGQVLTKVTDESAGCGKRQCVLGILDIGALLQVPTFPFAAPPPPHTQPSLVLSSTPTVSSSVLELLTPRSRFGT